ncbi:DUF397 domain-containing protein [Streptomyces sp. NPDC059582]|uniref:DUF397 domain-containing protein n=1 Tax=Streptomyces sp. NPDC059582 TaxID=3346875 RepID=UPI00367E3590
MSSEEPTWVKSSYSGGEGGECLEVAVSPHTVRVRDSKRHEAGPVLALTPATWADFLTYAVK